MVPMAPRWRVAPNQPTLAGEGTVEARKRAEA
jgi:hypothetical protein